MPIRKQIKIIVFAVFAFILTGLIFRNLHLASTPFYDWDEGMYAQIAKEIISNKSLFTTFNGQVWLDKPPLSHALIAFTFLIFGQSEFWARMMMIAIAFLLLILTYKAAKKLYLTISDKNNHPYETLAASLLPVLILAGSPIFMDRVALLNSDTLISVSWIGYLIYQDQYWMKLLFLTLGVWSKSVLGFYPLCLDIVIGLLRRFAGSKFRKYKFDLKTIFSTSQKVFVFILIPSLWYVAGLMKYGYGFIYNHFESQVLKRISVPIELHTGDKFYYFTYLWEKMGFMNLLFIAGYLIFFIKALKQLFKEKTKFFNEKNLLIISFILAPFPFLIFLTFMKTKIYWYVIMFFPFLCLSTLYVSIFLKNKLLKFLFFTGVFIYFLVNFSNQTFFSKTPNDTTERIILAKCVSKTANTSVAFLVDENERKIQNVLEAAHYDTTSSFLYGGSPSFVYYIGKKINYYYSVDAFITDHKNYSLLIMAKSDIADNTVPASLYLNKKTICGDEDWLSVVQY